MDDLSVLIKDVISDDNSLARKSFFEIEKGIKSDLYSQGELEEIVPILAEAIPEKTMKFWPVFLLALLAKNRIDIGAAVPNLELKLNVSYQEGGRDFVVRALDSYYYHIKNEPQLGPLPELIKINDWELKKYSRRPFYSCLDMDLAAQHKSLLPCPICGGVDTKKTFYSEETVGTNISGADIFTYEIVCMSCFIFSVFSTVDSFGPTG
ncbi:MAG: hypothetical protein JXJ04_24495 [Spirochaetales bacterium]|nr:hypothetical protein [Spirochaetales bacterium]